jgi:nucleoside-diphosphate-sugar epimerase
VLGGCGFIGSRIVDALLDAGHGVRGMDRAPDLYLDNIVLAKKRGG